MNNLNDVVIASALNRSLYNLTEITLALGKRHFTATKQYVLLANKLRNVYTQNDFLASIEPVALFQAHDKLEGYETSIQSDWTQIAKDMQHHLNFIDIELAKNKYTYIPDEEVDTLLEDSENAFFDIATEISEPTPEYDYAYLVRYTSGGALMINNHVITRPRLDGAVDRALQSAFKQPEITVEVSGNLTKFKHDIKLPNSFKNMLFRVSAGKIEVKPHITQAMLDEAGITRAEIDESLSKFERVK